MGTTSEVLRQVVHIAVGSLAVLLGVLSWWQAAAGAIAAVLVNRFVLVRAMPRLFRERDHAHPWVSGIVLYPVAVLGLILVFRSRLDLAAAAWAILAAGDGAATLVGAHVRTRPLLWNPRKTVAGLAAFLVCGSAAATAVFLWTTTDPGPLWWLVAMPVLATVVAGFAETAPIGLDDNITVPVVSALALGTLGTMNPVVLADAVAHLQVPILVGLMATALVALLGWAARTVTASGAIAGTAIGTAIVAGAGWPGWGLLMAAFITVSVMTRAGFARKAALGIAEGRGGRRGPANAIANTGSAAWLALVSLGLINPEWAWIGLTAALVTGASDTVASEAGKAWGRTTLVIVGFRRVPAGTPGAVSLEGTAAGATAAAALSALAASMGLIPGEAILLVTVAAIVASFVEGVLGATLESSGILDNDALNFVNATLGAGLALAVWPLI